MAWMDPRIEMGTETGGIGRTIERMLAGGGLPHRPDGVRYRMGADHAARAHGRCRRPAPENLR